jgi:hypothetical protein
VGNMQMRTDRSADYEDRVLKVQREVKRQMAEVYGVQTYRAGGPSESTYVRDDRGDVLPYANGVYELTLDGERVAAVVRQGVIDLMEFAQPKK